MGNKFNCKIFGVVITKTLGVVDFVSYEYLIIHTLIAEWK